MASRRKISQIRKKAKEAIKVQGNNTNGHFGDCMKSDKEQEKKVCSEGDSRHSPKNKNKFRDINDRDHPSVSKGVKQRDGCDGNSGSSVCNGSVRNGHGGDGIGWEGLGETKKKMEEGKKENHGRKRTINVNDGEGGKKNHDESLGNGKRKRKHKRREAGNPKKRRKKQNEGEGGGKKSERRGTKNQGRGNTSRKSHQNRQSANHFRSTHPHSMSNIPHHERKFYVCKHYNGAGSDTGNQRTTSSNEGTNSSNISSGGAGSASHGGCRNGSSCPFAHLPEYQEEYRRFCRGRFSRFFCLCSPLNEEPRLFEPPSSSTQNLPLENTDTLQHHQSIDILREEEEVIEPLNEKPQQLQGPSTQSPLLTKPSPSSISKSTGNGIDSIEQKPIMMDIIAIFVLNNDEMIKQMNILSSCNKEQHDKISFWFKFPNTNITFNISKIPPEKSKRLRIFFKQNKNHCKKNDAGNMDDDSDKNDEAKKNDQEHSNSGSIDHEDGIESQCSDSNDEHESEYLMSHSSSRALLIDDDDNDYNPLTFKIEELDENGNSIEDEREKGREDMWQVLGQEGHQGCILRWIERRLPLFFVSPNCRILDTNYQKTLFGMKHRPEEGQVMNLYERMYNHLLCNPRSGTHDNEYLNDFYDDCRSSEDQYFYWDDRDGDASEEEDEHIYYFGDSNEDDEYLDYDGQDGSSFSNIFSPFHQFVFGL